MNENVKKFFPVIHCADPYSHNGTQHVYQNIRIALENFADGIFLIGHGLRHTSMIGLYNLSRKLFPDFWIGINFLDVSRESEFERIIKSCPGLNALWTDGMPNIRLDIDPQIEVFGGVAFKYLNPNQSGDELVLACNKAKKIVDVVTTSGNATGFPPDIKKLEKIRNCIKQMPLALASGVTEDNVLAFLPTVDYFLVASSIVEKKGQENLDYFIPEKVKKLATIIHSKNLH